MVPLTLAAEPRGRSRLQPAPWFADACRAAGLDAFQDVCGSAAKDYLVETVGSGVALFDFDGDGLTDILFINGSTFQVLADPSLSRAGCRLFRNNGDGSFTDVTRASGLLYDGWGMGVAVADYDNDGHPDVFITGFGRNALFHNNGNGTFTDVTREAGLAGGNWSTGCAWGDYDGDGRLDLYVARYVDFDRSRIPRPGGNGYCLYQGIPVACGPLGLPALPDLVYHNEGNGTFREVSRDIGITGTDRAYGFSVVWSDLDNDGHLDAYVANDSTPNFFWHNRGNGTFEEVGFDAGCALSADGRAQSSMGIAIADAFNDGNLDILVTNFSEDYNTLYRNHGGRFEDISFEAGLGAIGYKNLGWGTAFLDFDNNGWQDLFIAHGHIYPQAAQAGNAYDQQNFLLRNQRDGTFRNLAPAESGFTMRRSSRGAAVGDLDNSGRLGIIVNNIDATPFYYRAQQTSENAWVRLRLTGTRSNRDAIGSRVRLTCGKVTQMAEVRSGDSYLSCSDRRLHFGLGAAGTIDRIDIRWPDGSSEHHENLAVNREYAFRQT